MRRFIAMGVGRPLAGGCHGGAATGGGLRSGEALPGGVQQRQVVDGRRAEASPGTGSEGLEARSEARGSPRRGGRWKDEPTTIVLEERGGKKSRAARWRPDDIRLPSRMVPQSHPDGSALIKKARSWPKRERRQQRSTEVCSQEEEVQVDARRWSDRGVGMPARGQRKWPAEGQQHHPS